ncbi:MAG: serine-rich protein [Chloroflexota bacterium]
MIRVLDNGLHIEEGVLRYAWFRLETPEGEKYRCVAFRELASVPYDVTRDADTLGRQWAALRGVYNAGVDYIYTALGIFQSEHVGIVQLYGAAGEGTSRETAAALALEGVTAVQAALANFPQSQTRAANLRWIEWYLEFVSRRAKNILALLGHPDPRASKRGLGTDGNLPDYAEDDLAEEQNEILFRGLAKLRQDFVFQVTAEHIDRKRLAQTVVDVARIASNFASRRRGSVNIGFSLGVPLMAALGQAIGGGQGGTQATAHSTAQGTSHGWGEAHSDSHSEGVSEGWTEGGSETHSTSRSWSHTESHAETNSTAHSHSQGRGSSWMSGTSVMSGMSFSHVESASNGMTVSSGTNHSETAGTSESLSANVGANVGGSADLKILGVGVGGTAGLSGSVGSTVGSSESVSNGTSSGVAASASQGVSNSYGWSSGTAHTSARGGSSFTSDTTTTGHAETHGTADTVGGSEGWATSRMWAHSTGKSEAWGTTDTKSESFGRSYAEGESVGQGTARNVAQAFTGGFSTGLVPGVNVGRSWQTEDDVADRLTEILRQFEGLVNQAASEGGFMTDALLLVDTDEGARAGETLVSQAFHGTNVPTPVLTLRVSEPQIKEYALSFTPCNESGGDLFGGMLWTKYGTLLTAGQLAAYTAPGLVEESTAVVTIAPTPKGLTFYPEMPGDVVLGHQYSPLTRDLTRAQVRLDADRLFHTMFAADTGYGKSVAAMRLAYETTVKWHLRTVVLDFGAGWRSLLNAPGLEGHVDIRQLWPTAARPLRWNPLQIGRNINPETQWRAFADIFGSVARLGVKRQKQELLDALRAVYLAAGVLVDDREVRGDPLWGRVQGTDEEAIAEASAGTPLGDLTIQQRQRLAVYRSSKVDLTTLYRQIEDKLSRVNPRDTMLTGVLEGILYRMNALVQGAAAAQFSAGPDCVPMEDLAKPWGIAIIEGGMFLDDFGKAFLLGWAGWHLYTDMVARRVHEVNTDEPILQIFFEEANKIFAGVDSGGGDDESGGVSLSQRFGDMFRDARKYKARLHVITQAPSLIPQDIISSCNNLVVGFLKNPKDKDIVLSGIARSEKGFVDEPWRRFLADLQIGMFLGRFPYAFQREMQQPFLFRPLAVVAPEPTDDEIAAKLGRITL